MTTTRTMYENQLFTVQDAGWSAEVPIVSLSPDAQGHINVDHVVGLVCYLVRNGWLSPNDHRLKLAFSDANRKNDVSKADYGPDPSVVDLFYRGYAVPATQVATDLPLDKRTARLLSRADRKFKAREN